MPSLTWPAWVQIVLFRWRHRHCLVTRQCVHLFGRNWSASGYYCHDHQTGIVRPPR